MTSDNLSIEQFFEQHDVEIHSRCYRIGKRLGLSNDAIDDLNQNVRLIIHQYYLTKPWDNFFAWLSMVIRNETSRLIKTDVREKQVLATIGQAERVSWAFDMKKYSEAHEACIESILSRIRSMPKRYRNILVGEAIRKGQFSSEEIEQLAVETQTAPENYLESNQKLTPDTRRARLKRSRDKFLQTASEESTRAMKAFGLVLGCWLLGIFLISLSSSETRIGMTIERSRIANRLNNNSEWCNNPIPLNGQRSTLAEGHGSTSLMESHGLVSAKGHGSTSFDDVNALVTEGHGSTSWDDQFNKKAA